MDINEEKNENKNIINENSKTTIIITIILLLIIIIFFVGYSITNSKNLDDINNYNIYTQDEMDLDNEVSLTNNDNNKSEEENMTGDIPIKDDNFFELNSDIPIGFSENFNDENVENQNDTLSNNNSNNNPNHTTNKENVSQLKIYHISKNDNDPNINKKFPYTIQIATHNQINSAQQIIDILKLKGYNAYIVKAVIKGKIKYRIRVGVFQTKEEAIKNRQNIIDKTNLYGIENSIIYKKSYN